MTYEIEFPPVENASPDGILAFGGVLTPEILVQAYTQGIFPWPISSEIPLAWFAPDPRGVLFHQDLHIHKKLIKSLQKTPFEIRYNTAFKEVIHECANCQNRPGQTETWITQQIINSYISLHKQQKAYSIETYLKGELVGGIYGVCIGQLVSGESMFYKHSNASKFALITLIKRLAERNIPFLDTQMITPIIESLGGRDISRDIFMKKISALDKNSNYFF